MFYCFISKHVWLIEWVPYVIVDSTKNVYGTYFIQYSFFILIASFRYQEEVLKLVLLALEEGSALSRYHICPSDLISYYRSLVPCISKKLCLDLKIFLFSGFSPKKVFRKVSTFLF
jgi:hypothetical protein